VSSPKYTNPSPPHPAVLMSPMVIPHAALWPSVVLYCVLPMGSESLGFPVTTACPAYCRVQVHLGPGDSLFILLGHEPLGGCPHATHPPCPGLRLARPAQHRGVAVRWHTGQEAALHLPRQEERPQQLWRPAWGLFLRGRWAPAPASPTGWGRRVASWVFLQLAHLQVSLRLWVISGIPNSCTNAMGPPAAVPG
jgi:hypothetical protein